MTRPEFHADYRPIEEADIRAATRGLQMATMAVSELEDVRNAHCNLDYFASKVIASAAQLELERRRCPNRAPWV